MSFDEVASMHNRTKAVDPSPLLRLVGFALASLVALAASAALAGCNGDDGDAMDDGGTMNAEDRPLNPDRVAEDLEGEEFEGPGGGVGR